MSRSHGTLVDHYLVAPDGAGNGETLHLISSRGVPVDTIYYNPVASRTGVIIDPGTEDGQRLTVVNTASGAYSITFATGATSNVAAGTGAVIGQNQAMHFRWSSSLARWVGAYGTASISDGSITTAKIADANVTLAKLAAGITPSHVVKYAGTVTWSGSGATYAPTVSGVVAGDIVIATIRVKPTQAAYLVRVVPSTDTLTFELSAANTSNDAQISYQVLRAAA